MTKIGIKRLLKLADHLEHGKLGHKIFDYSAYNTTDDYKTALYGKCGTHGCAIGECPIAFPGSWEFGRNGFPVLKNKADVLESGKEFFNLSANEYRTLFIGNSLYSNGKRVFRLLREKARRKTVAKRLRKFVKLKEEGVI